MLLHFLNTLCLFGTVRRLLADGHVADLDTEGDEEVGWKEQRNISLQRKDEEASNLQALIPGASCVEDE